MLNVGKYKENDLVDVKTQSLMPNASSPSNSINASLIAPYRYGQMLPLARPSASPSVPVGQTSRAEQTSKSVLQTSYHNIDPIKKNYFNGVDLQVQTSGFPNPSIRTTFYNQNNLPSHPYGANSLYPSHQRNNSEVFNDLNPHPRVNINSLNGVMDIATPSLSTPIQNQNLDQLSYKDLTRERAEKRFLCESQENDVMASASKRPKLSFTPPNYYQGVPFGMKELLVSKGEKLPNSTSKIKADAKKNIDKDNLDLSLHL